MMRIFQLVIAILTLLMSLGMFAFNTWINSNFAKGLDNPGCFMPMNIITTVLIVITVLTIFIRK